MFKRPSVLYVLIAIVALVLGLLVYLFDRRPEHVYFLFHGLVLAHGHHPLFGVVGNYLPTFVHVYAFILLTVAVAGSTKARLTGICAAWFVVAALFELAQLPAISATIAAMVPAWFARVPILDNTAAYFLNGSFDVLDILSIALGTVAAYLTVAMTSRTVRATLRKDRHRALRRGATAGVVVLGLLTIIASGGGGSGTPDTTPPTVVSTSPASGATIVAIGADITATFSEALTASTVNGASFTLVVAGSGAPVSATVSYSGTTATLHPTSNLAPSTMYTATITTDVKDLAGNAMAADYVWSFTTATDSWLSTTTTGAPTARSGHTAVWTGSKMIVWGGTDSLGLTNTGSRYDPSTVPDSWLSTTTTGAPTARSGHTAVWTGSKMIVWGGTDSLGLTNTGSRYDPSADSWQATATSGLTSRSGHTAVWTGSKMIVWGGYDGTLTNTGSRYDPSTVPDSWQATSMANVPTPRSGHTAVWTGTEMIVWGGSDNSVGLTNSGGRYNPVSDTWQSMSTVGAPSGRTGHTAVWTGTEMIVWGGNDGGLTNTGGRYNPSTDTWQTVSTIGAPSARTGHIAIWTGTHMIVWGGNDGGLTNTGGIYDPTTDTWQTITVTGAPPGRSGHTAVWSGSEMIVWGGSGLNTGGRYTP